VIERGEGRKEKERTFLVLQSFKKNVVQRNSGELLLKPNDYHFQVVYLNEVFFKLRRNVKGNNIFVVI